MLAINILIYVFRSVRIYHNLCLLATMAAAHCVFTPSPYQSTRGTGRVVNHNRQAKTTEQNV